MGDNESTSTMLAALASLLISGWGQFLQGRKMMAATQFLLWIILWIFLAGWVITIWSVVDVIIHN